MHYYYFLNDFYSIVLFYFIFIFIIVFRSWFHNSVYSCLLHVVIYVSFNSITSTSLYECKGPRAFLLISRYLEQHIKLLQFHYISFQIEDVSSDKLCYYTSFYFHIWHILISFFRMTYGLYFFRASVICPSFRSIKCSQKTVREKTKT